ncbi:hypothetical protein Cpap_4237 [Ruminiclostridium papyrosolvens DSM 2782]|uniref:Uncharacterized protein n=1 Tax=Ruminiclostridium papyrosolvens DSM 2782 TaxID=588581 RepID=F1T8J5_9FIRM|nr:DUF6323 family protein [Ruminiclostridium papyrosolvens]EGD49793.1 hypothetical protein Cpap_4237 [Ruminiclostridium papyrosolvens DSM 2782]WES33079.1 DUF6323 family protein [Ruminiclostridium papyrosolvens DSM 2782]
MKDFLQIQKLLSQNESEINQIEKCNEFSSKFGLVLTNAQIRTLSEERYNTLKRYGRVELGKGILDKLIFEFCDSPFIWQENYMDTLSDLQDIFYYFKNESLDEFTDDELIRYMRKSFDNECQGSIEYLRETSLEDVCRSIRYGQEAYKYFDTYEDELE